MKKETKRKLVIIHWVVIYILATIGILGVTKYLIYGTIY